MSAKSSTKKNRINKHKVVIISISIMLFLISALITLALLSYSRMDEANAQLTFGELTGLISGDEILRAKAALTKNLLGITGAMISYFLINKLIGLFSLVFPILLFFWSKDLFFEQRISNRTLKETSFWLLFSFLIAAFLGSVSQLSWVNIIPKELYGAVGFFISSIFVNLLGAFGSSIIILGLISVSLILTAKLKINTEKIKGISDNLKDKAVRSMNQVKDQINIKKPEEEIDNDEIVGEHNAKDHEEQIEKQHKKQIVDNDIPEPKAFSPVKIVKKTLKVDKPQKYENKEYQEETIENEVFDEKSKINEELEESEEIKQENQETSNELLNEEITSEDTNHLEKDEAEDLVSLDNFDEEEDIFEYKNNDSEIEDFAEDNDGNSEKEINQNPQDDDTAKPLTVEVNQIEEEEQTEELNFPIGNEIHDEEIKFTRPSIELLTENTQKAEVNDDELKMKARILQEKLETFKIHIENLTVTPGPVVTQYEFVPAEGIKVSKIENLSDDIEMALKSQGIRIIAPIPGKGTVGVEIPNSIRSIVRFKEIVTSKKFRETKAKLPLGLGKTISGEVFITDLAKMPHLLIAGSTGSGKSVGINTIIASLVYKLHPSQLKFVLVDPKKVELPQYNKLKKHFIAVSPELDKHIITEPDDAVIILKAVVAEMEKRYDILAHVGQRNIADYNEKVEEGKYENDEKMQHRKMPYLVVIIDELADLMLTASKEIEEPIIRLAQMARAVGIHLIIATQRPSVDVITGIIKANFPARISYAVRSRIDSRTILDMGGAENLIGQGDMLCLTPGMSDPIRVQNSFLSTDETENICEYIGDQNGYSTPYILPNLNEKKQSGGGINPEDRDPLFEDAARLIIRNQQGSVSLIQRRLKVGYARAGRIVDELEEAGIVGPFDGSKARQVLLESESDLGAIL